VFDAAIHEQKAGCLRGQKGMATAMPHGSGVKALKTEEIARSVVEIGVAAVDKKSRFFLRMP
jgi:hypothetical protein